jgi:hypothetical protein
MENASILLHSSDNGNSSLAIREFPYWQPTLAVVLSLLTISQAGSILIICVPLLVVLLRVVKKDHFKALNLLHVSLVIASIIEDVGHIILYPIQLPYALRFCVCPSLVNTLFAVLFVFFLIYRPFCFSCLSILQFLVVIGKKKFVTLKVSGIIAVCSGLAVIYTASSVKPTHDTVEKYICYESFCPNSRSESPFGLFVISYLFVSHLYCFPSNYRYCVTMSIWFCAVFKNYYTGGDDQLNRRMFSLPFIMPLANLASSVVEGAQIMVVGLLISMLPLGDLFPYWIMFIKFLLASFLRFFIRLVYPSVLLYTHRKLCRAIKLSIIV